LSNIAWVLGLENRETLTLIKDTGNFAPRKQNLQQLRELLRNRKGMEIIQKSINLLHIGSILDNATYERDGIQANQCFPISRFIPFHQFCLIHQSFKTHQDIKTHRRFHNHQYSEDQRGKST